MRLSKSRLVAYRQCPKRSWLQIHRRDLAEHSEAAENRMAQGHLVGAAAQRLFTGGRLIGHVTDLTSALQETAEALAQPGDITLFEPALQCADILVRADVLERRGGTYRLIEVKSSTKAKGYQVTDAGIQTWVARGAGLAIERTELAHINNQFIYSGHGDYHGLFTNVDVTDAVHAAARTDSDVDRRRAARSRRSNAGHSRRSALQRSARVRIRQLLRAERESVSGQHPAAWWKTGEATSRRRLRRSARRSG